MDKITIEDDNIIVGGNVSIDGELSVDKLTIASTGLRVQHARIGTLPGGNADQTTFMNKEQKYNSIGYPGDAEQIKKYCLMQDVNGISHLNSPIKTLIRIKK